MRIVRPNGAYGDSDIWAFLRKARTWRVNRLPVGFVDRYWALLLNGCGCATVAQWLFPAENLR